MTVKHVFCSSIKLVWLKFRLLSSFKPGSHQDETNNSNYEFRN